MSTPVTHKDHSSGEKLPSFETWCDACGVTFVHSCPGPESLSRTVFLPRTCSVFCHQEHCQGGHIWAFVWGVCLPLGLCRRRQVLSLAPLDIIGPLWFRGFYSRAVLVTLERRRGGVFSVSFPSYSPSPPLIHSTNIRGVFDNMQDDVLSPSHSEKGMRWTSGHLVHLVK